MDTDLAKLVQYQNQDVIHYFCYHHSEFSLAQAQQLFADLLGWLWLNQQRASQDKKTYLFGPLLALDKLWHTFILHTRAYVDFSMHYFGAYVHHDVEPIGFEHVMNEEELRDYLEDCCRYLGEEWVARRFIDALD